MNMNKIIISSFVIMAIFTQASNAAEYYWVNNWGDSFGKFGTPKQACDDALDDYNWRGVDPSNYPDGRGVAAIILRSMTLHYPSKTTPYPYYTCDGTFVFTDPNRPPWTTTVIGMAYRYGNICPPGTTENPTTAECTNDVNKGESCLNKGNPINIATGNKFQQEIDYETRSGAYLPFRRAYNSLDGIWRHSYSTYLRILPHSIAVVFADGREVFFANQNDMIVPIGAELGVLVKLTDGWLYKSTTDQQLSFSSQGKLTDFISPGRHVQLSYMDDNVTVRDLFGNSAIITVRPDGQPLRLQVADIEVNYSYDDSNRLVLVDYPDGTARRYHYNEAFHTSNTNQPYALTGISNIDKNGIATLYATYSYDSKGRATSSEYAGGAGRISLTFNDDGSTTETNALGKQTTYHFELFYGKYKAVRVEGHPTASCAGANKTYTYDGDGFMISRSDWNGITTTYTHDAQGRELSRTEAVWTPQERTVTTEWHPEYRLPVRINEPGKTTEFTYDAQGRELSRTVREEQ
jgi:YD repeat-containing protein